MRARTRHASFQAALLVLALIAGRTFVAQDPQTTAPAGSYRDPSLPYPFYSLGTVRLAPGPQYAAGPIKRFFLGDGYRNLWTAPVELPVIDLERTVGGLTPLQLGGGNQSVSLHLLGGDGHEYRLRLIEKKEAETLPSSLQGTFAEGIAEDLGSALNPFAPSVVAELARTAGILHTAPILVYVPDSPRLGPFQDEVGGRIALFERKPDEDQSEAERFGNAHNVIGTETLLEALALKANARVDQRAYARARLFDMLIGDWDRHEGQWRWAEYPTPSGTRYVPIPIDRDYAFARYGGLLINVGQITGDMRLRRLVYFDDSISSLKALNWQARALDARFTDKLTREDWVTIANQLQQALTDEAIEQAVRTWPESVFRLIGPETIRALKARRDQLPEVAAQYYDLLAGRDDATLPEILPAPPASVQGAVLDGLR